MKLPKRKQSDVMNQSIQQIINPTVSKTFMNNFKNILEEKDKFSQNEFSVISNTRNPKNQEIDDHSRKYSIEGQSMNRYRHLSFGNTMGSMLSIDYQSSSQNDSSRGCIKAKNLDSFNEKDMNLSKKESYNDFNQDNQAIFLRDIQENPSFQQEQPKEISKAIEPTKMPNSLNAQYPYMPITPDNPNRPLTENLLNKTGINTSFSNVQKAKTNANLSENLFFSSIKQNIQNKNLEALFSIKQNSKETNFSTSKRFVL